VHATTVGLQSPGEPGKFIGGGATCYQRGKGGQSHFDLTFSSMYFWLVDKVSDTFSTWAVGFADPSHLFLGEILPGGYKKEMMS